MFLGVSDITREVDRAFLLIGGVSLLLLIGITVAMVVFAVKFRRSRRRKTSQVSGNTVLEITWTVIPTLIVIWMFFVGYRGFELMGRVPDDHMVVHVTGKQWVWTFHYPEERVDASEMVVPVDKAVLVKLTAPPEDVIHSFYIPAFRTKEDALPGRESTMWFKPEREGTYSILCAEFCGKDHSQMTAWLKVVSREVYDQWIQDQQLKKFRPLEWDAIANPDSPGFQELNIDARVVYEGMCASCHGTAGDGSGLPGEARSFASLEDWKRGPKVTDIYRTLTDGIEGSRMRAFPNLTPWERVAVAHYVRAFSKEPLPQDTREDYDALVEEYGLDKIQTPKDTIPIERAMELLINETDSSEQANEDSSAPDTP
jgi:cytochrome c oxidase subunit 2